MRIKQKIKKSYKNFQLHRTYKKMRKVKEKQLKENNCDLRALLFYDVKGILKQKANGVVNGQRITNIKKH